MSFAFKEELNELVIFCRCCSADNLWAITLSRLSIIELADLLHESHGSNMGPVGELEPLGPHELGATAADDGKCCLSASGEDEPLVSHIVDSDIKALKKDSLIMNKVCIANALHYSSDSVEQFNEAKFVLFFILKLFIFAMFC